jgi:hypothetical protein
MHVSPRAEFHHTRCGVKLRLWRILLQVSLAWSGHRRAILELVELVELVVWERALPPQLVADLVGF